MAKSDTHTQLRRPPPWIFSVLALPVGIYLGFLTTSLPFLLKKGGSSVEQVATVGAVLRLPALLFFLWAPPRRFRFAPPVVAGIGGSGRRHRPMGGVSTGRCCFNSNDDTAAPPHGDCCLDHSCCRRRTDHHIAYPLGSGESFSLV